MTPEELRALVGEATPGPWRWHTESTLDEIRIHGLSPMNYVAEILDPEPGSAENARLIALAPQLAMLCVEMATALKTLKEDSEKPGGSFRVAEMADALLDDLKAVAA